MSANVQVNQGDNASPSLDNDTTESEPSIAVTSSAIVVGYNDSRDYATLGLGGLKSITGFAYSNNGGVSFVDAGRLAPASGFMLLGDPSLAVDNAGNFFFASLAVTGLLTMGGSRVSVARSTSVAPSVIFGTPVQIQGLLTTGAPFEDKEMIAVDTTGGAFDGRIYVVWSEFASLSDLTPRLLFARSITSSPLAFAPTVALTQADSFHHGGMIAIGPSGEVYVVWGRFVWTGGSITGESIRLLKSTDGGVSFVNPDASDPSPNKVVATPIPTAGEMTSGGVAIRTRGFPYIAVDRTPTGSRTRGNVYVVFQAIPFAGASDRSDIFFTRSTDGGVTWSNPIPVNKSATLGADTTNNDNWQPFIVVSPTNGEITVTFYDRRGDPANKNITLYKAVSTDGGLTWFNAPISSGAFTPSTGYDPILQTDYMGDYNFGVADGTNFHLVWGDCRNICAPPTGAANACSPIGRPDQDVFYARDAQLAGPDLAITPWGATTGIGPLWQSPDIYVVDSMNNSVNAAKGQINNLRAHVRNVGNAPAAGVVVRFKYAPIFVGLTDSALKQIGTVTSDFAAAGDPTGNDDRVLPIAWDLTNLTDTNGGLWPSPISAFDHFCVKVSVEFIGDVNLANNNAQTNFVDVPTVLSPTRFIFMVANPFDREVSAQLQMEGVPKDFQVEFIEFPPGFGHAFKLKPKEIKLVTIAFTPPKGFEKSPPTGDLIAHISLRIGQEEVGGLSARLFEAGPNKRMFGADYGTIFKAVLTVLQNKKEATSLSDESRGLINTKSIPASNEMLRHILDAKASEFIGKGEGRYLLSFHLRRVTEAYTTVSIDSLIIVSAPFDNPLGGQPMPTNGVLEREHLDAIARLVYAVG